MKKSNIRVIVRPWTPRNIPYEIAESEVQNILKTAYPNLRRVLYVGWTRRKMNDKSTLCFIAATGETAAEARATFKTSENFGTDIWLLNGAQI